MGSTYWTPGKKCECEPRRQIRTEDEYWGVIIQQYCMKQWEGGRLPRESVRAGKGPRTDPEDRGHSRDRPKSECL